MKNKNNFMGIIIPVVVAVILLTVLPIINSINVECPPCENIPTLYTPTISISGDTLTITPNSNNGAFVSGYKIYVDNILLDTTTSTTYDLSEELTEIGTYEIYVTVYATLFIDSEPSNIEEYVVEPIPTGPKAFEVGDVLPTTTQLRISWLKSLKIADMFTIKTQYQTDFIFYLVQNKSNDHIRIADQYIYNDDSFVSPYTNFGGAHAYIDINTSSWSLDRRTITAVEKDGYFAWEDLNA